MFEWLTDFKKILVTGPHRSGTRICAQTVARDTGYEYIDEIDLHMDSLHDMLSIYIHKKDFVAQCPALCRYIHLFSAQDTAIIFMCRKIEDIQASQKRIKWSHEWLELARYDRNEGTIAEVKYQFWQEYQKDKIIQPFEIDYESLADHPMWVSKPLRNNFRAEQTQMPGTLYDIKGGSRPFPTLNVHFFDGLDQTTAILTKYGHTLALNDTGGLIWKLCDGSHTRQDILQILKSRFDDIQEDILAHHLDDFIQKLVQSGYLQLSDKTSIPGLDTSGKN